MHRRLCVLGASAAAVTCLTLAGAAQAAQPTAISGTVPNGGCDAARTVPVSGPSRIEVEVASTSAANSVFGEIVAPDGRVVAAGAYDTPSGGAYAIRVCSTFDTMDPPSMQYTGRYATGPAGQPALPRSQAVFATQATTSHDVHGAGAIRTRAGLAWFTVKLDKSGMAIVKVLDPRTKKHYLFTGATVSFGTNAVRITGNGMTLTLVQSGATERIVFHSLRFRASGKVIRGSYTIV